MANKTIKEEKEIIKEESVVEEKKELSQEESRSKKFWKPIGNFFKTNVIFTKNAYKSKKRKCLGVSFLHPGIFTSSTEQDEPAKEAERVAQEPRGKPGM